MELNKVSEVELLRVRIIKNKEKIRLFKLNNDELVVNHLKTENIKLKKLMERLEEKILC